MAKTYSEQFIPLRIAVLTVSDSRTEATDTSGQLLVERLTAAGHRLAEKRILRDDLYRIRAQVAVWVASADVQVVLITGGTGFTGRDSTPQAVAPLFREQRRYRDELRDGVAHLFTPRTTVRVMPRVYEGGFGDAIGAAGMVGARHQRAHAVRRRVAVHRRGLAGQ